MPKDNGPNSPNDTVNEGVPDDLAYSRKGPQMTYRPIFKYWYMFAIAVFTLVPMSNMNGERLDEREERESIDEREIFEDLRELLDSLPKNTRIDPNVSIYGHGRGYSFPPEPVTFHGDQKRQHAWQRVLKQCDPVSTKSALTTECMAALTEYFDDEPVWKYSRLYYYSEPMGLLLTTYNEINRRHYRLPYGYDDYSMEQLPRWSDIFDGRLEQRVATFSRVAQDPQCRELSSFADTGIQEDRAEQCSAHEMYKYAAYLDACTTALQRLAVLSSPTRSSKEKYRGLDRFEVSKFVILENIESAADRDFAQENVEKGLLHASWVSEQCTVNPFTLDTTRRNNRNSAQNISWRATTVVDEAFARSIKQTHDVALRIAAKCGDERAIRSSPRLYGVLLSDTFERYPLLVHRHLGSNTGGISEELEWNERRRHEAKAYLLLKDLAGSEVAQREFDPSKMQEEIDYILKGGELRLPRWIREIF